MTRRAFDVVAGSGAARLSAVNPTATGAAYAYLQDNRRTRPDVYHEAASVAAAGAGLDGDALSRTVLAYNADPKARGARPALRTPPFVVLGPVKAYLPFTAGGLAVSETLQVLDHTGAPIPGLYAAGSNGQGGVLLEGHGHHPGWAFVSGRIAGRNAAREPAATSPRIDARKPMSPCLAPPTPTRPGKEAMPITLRVRDDAIGNTALRAPARARSGAPQRRPIVSRSPFLNSHTMGTAAVAVMANRKKALM